MKPGSLGMMYEDREQPMIKHIAALAEISEVLFRRRRGCSVRPGVST